MLSLSDRIESVQYLDEFITIRNNVSSSISEVMDDVEQTVQAAEAPLSGLYYATSKVSTRLLPALRQEIAISSTLLCARRMRRLALTLTRLLF